MDANRAPNGADVAGLCPFVGRGVRVVDTERSNSEQAVQLFLQHHPDFALVTIAAA